MATIASTVQVETASVSYKNRVRKISYGDGYVARQRTGINTQVKVWQVTFMPGTQASMQTLENILFGDLNFDITYWQAPDESNVTAWLVNSVSKSYIPGNLVQLSATLERVFL